VKIDMDSLSALSQGGLLEAIHPCRVTQNLFRAVIDLHARLVEVEGEFPADEQGQQTMLHELAETAVDRLQDGELARELDTLGVVALSLDMRPAVSFHLVAWKPLGVGENLRVILRSVYAAVLFTVVFSLPRA
jgi:hypothetical protein